MSINQKKSISAAAKSATYSQSEGTMNRLQAYLAKTDPTRISAAAVAFLAMITHLESESPEVAKALVQELQDQRSHLKMIASENYSSLAVQLAMGNWLTDKYAEGYAHHRFYAGCENIDTVEELACNRLKELYGAEHAYVQPHSGADANLVAFWAMMVKKVQDPAIERLGKKNLNALTDDEYEEIRQLFAQQTIMGMSLNSGGHLTHGYRHNISAKMMRAVTYDVNPETGLLDYDAIQKQAKAERPFVLIAGYSSYPRLINFAKMREIADSVDAYLMVDMAHFSGLVAGKVMQGDFDPVKHAHIVTSTTHKTLRGPRGGLILCKEELKESVDKGCPLALGGPLPHVMAAKAVAFQEALSPEFRDYAKQVVTNAQTLAKHLADQGCHLVTGGTDNHLLVLDVSSSFNLNGRHAENALRESGITVNRNAIPFDPNGAWYTSGVRLGTPALTTRGMQEKEMAKIADLIVMTLKAAKPKEINGKVSKSAITMDHEILEQIRSEVAKLLRHFPLYPELEIE